MPRTTEIWIVFTDNPNDPETILGVFATSAEADRYFNEIRPELSDTGLTYGRYEIGFRHNSADGGTGRYRSAP